MRPVVWALAFGLATAPAVAAQTTIGAPGGGEVRTWGVGNTRFYGQTFTTPTENILNSFSLWLGRASPLSSTPPPSINFRAYVYAWNNVARRASGSALFTSALTNHAASSSTPFTQYAFGTGGLGLVSGKMYVMFIEAVSGSGGIFVQSNVKNDYKQGDFFFNNSTSPTTTWSGPGFPTATDLKFDATFSAVPEPSTWILLATGLVLLGVGARTRRRLDDGDTA